MGGDDGVRTILAGVALARSRGVGCRFLLVGQAGRIAEALAAHPDLRAAVDILDAPDVISGEDKPSQAIRRAKTTSMGLAINAVKSGEAGAALSAGNTGALMAMAKLALRTLPGIDRPALAVVDDSTTVALRDSFGRLAIHPARRGTLNHLHTDLFKVEAKIQHLSQELNLPRDTKERLGALAKGLWKRARAAAAQRESRSTA